MRLCLVIVLVFYMSTHVRLMRCDQKSTFFKVDFLLLKMLETPVFMRVFGLF